MRERGCIAQTSLLRLFLFLFLVRLVSVVRVGGEGDGRTVSGVRLAMQ